MQQLLFGRDPGLLESPAEIRRCSLRMMQLRFEFPKDSVKQIVGLKLSTIAKGFNGRHARGWTVDVRYCDGPVQGDDR